MAVDVCAKISLSCDLNQAEDTSHKHLNTNIMDSSSDFNFCMSTTLVQELSTADELFSDGKILPIGITKKHETKTHKFPELKSVKSCQDQPPNGGDQREKKLLKEFLAMSFEDEEHDKPTSKSFWTFKRSSSLNCESTRSKGLIRPLQILYRSNSTGSVPNQKQAVNYTKDSSHNKQRLHKQNSVHGNRSSGSCPSTHYPYGSSQKPPMKNYANGIRVSPVLNLSPHISRGTLSIFGSIFCNSKTKKKR